QGIHEIATAEPDRLAVVHGHDRLAFGELEAAINRAAHALVDAGIAPGDAVAAVLHNGPEYLVLLNAAARLGADFVPVGYRLTAPEARYIVEDSGSRVVLVDRRERARDLEALPGVQVWHVDDARLRTGPVDPPRGDRLDAMPVPLQYTSGTTGRPKGVVRERPEPARGPQPNLAALLFGYRPGGVHLVSGPLYHAAPGGHAQMNLWTGAAVVLLDRFRADDALDAIERERVTSSFMTPAHFVRILEADWASRDRSSVERIWHAGAPCPPAVKRRMLEVFPGAIWEFYGMSEGLGGVVSPDEWLERPGTVGRALPSLSYRILDESGCQLPPGEVGLVYVSAIPGQEFRYRDDDAKTAAAWRDGFYTVGDMGWLDDDGYLYLADRRTDLILRNGMNVYPAEVEQVLAEHPDVVDAAVIGLPDERSGQRVHAIVELRPGGRGPEALRSFLGERLADYKVPSTIEVVDELPRELNGKVLKRRLREDRTPPVAPEQLEA
ncbi:MAG TPA: AMP-binding protein, partial [Acidimicrobiales bacterium]|nr:AMP-binding protein [Acidimicrobiales bacterium]